MASFMQMAPRLYLGEGASEGLGQRFKDSGVKSVLFFTDKMLRKLGTTASLEASLGKAGIALAVADNVAAEPTVKDVENAIAPVAGKKPDAIVACGGGSVMDTAKLASVLIGASYTLKDLLVNPAQARKQIKTVMLPTTCGTGSEATCNAIVAIPEEETKKGIVNNEMICDEVILDPLFIAKLPPKSVAATGVDALAHCVECWTSNKATPLSDTYAAAGAKLIFHYIEEAYYNSDNMDAKSAMLLGANYGGCAITGSGTTAVHALAYPLGGKYHIAHGVSNAILFADVMKFNGRDCPAFTERLASLCEAVYPEKHALSSFAKADYLIDRIAEIVKNTEIPTSLKDFGLKESDLEALVKAGSEQTRLLVNNMKKLSLDDIRAIYKKVI
jgi:alcohol dehydrogenase class IV